MAGGRRRQGEGFGEDPCSCRGQVNPQTRWYLDDGLKSQGECGWVSDGEVMVLVFGGYKTKWGERLTFFVPGDTGARVPHCRG